MNKDLLFSKFPCLETKEIILKKIEIEDANNLFEILTNKNIFKYTPGNPLKTMEAVKNVIDHHERDFNKRKTIFLGIFLKNEKKKLVGIAEIFDFNYDANSVEIGYRINENYWGKGLATKATALMVEYLFNEINVNRIQATPMPINKNSHKVLINNRFVCEGTLRQCKKWTGTGIVDLTFYSILKSKYVKK